MTYKRQFCDIGRCVIQKIRTELRRAAVISILKKKPFAAEKLSCVSASHCTEASTKRCLNTRGKRDLVQRVSAREGGDAGVHAAYGQRKELLLVRLEGLQHKVRGGGTPRPANADLRLTVCKLL